jgi:hypothetical protein
MEASTTTRNHSSKRKFNDTVSSSTNNIDLSLLEDIEKYQPTIDAVDNQTLKNSSSPSNVD